jgi:hypothetical protein
MIRFDVDKNLNKKNLNMRQKKMKNSQNRIKTEKTENN